MFSSLEIIAIIVIVCVQLVIAFRVYKQISNLNNFLPNGRHSLSLEEYSIPANKIAQLEPSDIVGCCLSYCNAIFMNTGRWSELVMSLL